MTSQINKQPLKPNIHNKENQDTNRQAKAISQSGVKSGTGQNISRTPRIPNVSPAQEKELTPLESLRLKNEKSENEPMVPNKGEEFHKMVEITSIKKTQNTEDSQKGGEEEQIDHKNSSSSLAQAQQNLANRRNNRKFLSRRGSQQSGKNARWRAGRTDFKGMQTNDSRKVRTSFMSPDDEKYYKAPKLPKNCEKPRNSQDLGHPRKQNKLSALAKHSSLPRPFVQESKLQEQNFCHTNANRVSENIIDRLIGPDPQLIAFAQRSRLR